MGWRGGRGAKMENGHTFLQFVFEHFPNLDMSCFLLNRPHWADSVIESPISDYLNFFLTILTVIDHIATYETLSNHFKPIWAKLEYFGTFKQFLDNFLLVWFNLAQFGSF